MSPPSPQPSPTPTSTNTTSELNNKKATSTKQLALLGFVAGGAKRLSIESGSVPMENQAGKKSTGKRGARGRGKKRIMEIEGNIGETT